MTVPSRFPLAASSPYAAGEPDHWLFLRPVEAANGLEQMGDSFEAGGTAIGAAGVGPFGFAPLVPDHTSSRLKYWREWEREDSS